MVMTTKYFNVLKPESFVDSNNEERTNFLKVGVAFPFQNGKEGFSITITEGISVTGEIVLLAPKPKTNDASADRGAPYVDPHDQPPGS
tara:strand:+ start:286 stop:549 length:264 start_codon:yes stop_codon:yes gene_type:complete